MHCKNYKKLLKILFFLIMRELSFSWYEWICWCYIEMRTSGIMYNRNMYLKRTINTISTVYIRTLAASRYNCCFGRRTSVLSYLCLSNIPGLIVQYTRHPYASRIFPSNLSYRRSLESSRCRFFNSVFHNRIHCFFLIQ